MAALPVSAATLAVAADAALRNSVFLGLEGGYATLFFFARDPTVSYTHAMFCGVSHDRVADAPDSQE
jgi:hypothetical protein